MEMNHPIWLILTRTNVQQSQNIWLITFIDTLHYCILLISSIFASIVIQKSLKGKNHQSLECVMDFGKYAIQFMKLMEHFKAEQDFVVPMDIARFDVLYAVLWYSND